MNDSLESTLVAMMLTLKSTVGIFVCDTTVELIASQLAGDR